MNIHTMEQRLKKIYADEGRLLSLHVDVLYACDLDCTHCYLDDKRTPLMDTETLRDLLRQARDLGAMKLTLSGGELFLREDVFDLIEEARSLRYYIRLKTHAGRITKSDAERMKALGVREIDVSVYALDPAAHDCITRRPGSLERTLRGILYMRDAGLTVKARCSVMETNKHHYQALHAAFTARGIECTVDGAIRVADSGSDHVCADALSPEDHHALEVFKLQSFRNPPTQSLRLDPGARICQAGNTAIHVQPNGNVTPCVAWPMPLGNLLKSSLKDIWNDSPELQPIRATRREDREGCGGCAHEHACLFCPGKAWIESEGAAPFASNPTQCSVTTAKESARLIVLSGSPLS